MKFTPEALLQEVTRLVAALPERSTSRLWVAFSGGLDSTVLLHALAAYRDELPARLAAVHVNHNLNPDSGRWAEHCRAECEKRDIPLEMFSVEVTLAAGASPEAAARDVRYDAFRELLAAGEVLFTAHHQDDQLETFLLQALRGAGPHGLAAMPPVSTLGQGSMARPLLGWPRSALEDWARSAGLRWLDDPSNSDERFDRNYLRRSILPLLRARWPAAAQTVSRSARHCADAAELVDELAAEDLDSCSGPERVLRVAALRRLEVSRRRNVVRHWLDWMGFPRPSERKLEHILTDVLEAGPDAEPCVDWADVAVHRYRDGLYAEPQMPSPQGGNWLPGDFDLGKGWGVLRRHRAGTAGLPEGRFEVRYREGGERLRPLGREHHHELRKLFQEAGVLPWRRAQIPLLYLDDVLAAVGDLWINADIVVSDGWRIEWLKKPRITAT